MRKRWKLFCFSIICVVKEACTQKYKASLCETKKKVLRAQYVARNRIDKFREPREQGRVLLESWNRRDKRSCVFFLTKKKRKILWFLLFLFTESKEETSGGVCVFAPWLSLFYLSALHSLQPIDILQLLWSNANCTKWIIHNLKKFFSFQNGIKSVQLLFSVLKNKSFPQLTNPIVFLHFLFFSQVWKAS